MITVLYIISMIYMVSALSDIAWVISRYLATVCDQYDYGVPE